MWTDKNDNFDDFNEQSKRRSPSLKTDGNRKTVEAAFADFCTSITGRILTNKGEMNDRESEQSGVRRL